MHTIPLKSVEVNQGRTPSGGTKRLEGSARSMSILAEAAVDFVGKSPAQINSGYGRKNVSEGI